MRTRPTLIALFILLMGFVESGEAYARGPSGKPFGVGMTLGDPVAVTGKYWFGQESAVDFGVGYNFVPQFHGAVFYVDYLYHGYQLLEPRASAPFSLKFYLGLGAKLGIWLKEVNHVEETFTGLVLRMPFGLTMVFSRVPFDTFVEIAPALAFINPDPVWFDIDFVLGGRFYF